MLFFFTWEVIYKGKLHDCVRILTSKRYSFDNISAMYQRNLNCIGLKWQPGPPLSIAGSLTLWFIQKVSLWSKRFLLLGSPDLRLVLVMWSFWRKKTYFLWTFCKENRISAKSRSLFFSVHGFSKCPKFFSCKYFPANPKIKIITIGEINTLVAIFLWCLRYNWKISVTVTWKK